MARYNVIAAFAQEGRAQRAVDQLTRTGLDRGHVRVLRPGRGRLRDRDRIAELKAEMQEEADTGWPVQPSGFLTRAQAQGAAVGVGTGAIAGIVFGAMVGLGWAFAADSSVSAFARFVIPVICFAIGGATAGVVAGGALKPRSEASHVPRHRFDDKTTSAEVSTLVAVHTGDEKMARRAQRLLKDSGAERVDAVNADGTPLPPQAEHPRPADPPDRWWRRGSRG